MYISIALGLVANAKQRRRLVEYSLNHSVFLGLSTGPPIELAKGYASFLRKSRKNGLICGLLLSFVLGKSVPLSVSVKKGSLFFFHIQKKDVNIQEKGPSLVP